MGVSVAVRQRLRGTWEISSAESPVVSGTAAMRPAQPMTVAMIGSAVSW